MGFLRKKLYPPADMIFLKLTPWISSQHGIPTTFTLPLEISIDILNRGVSIFSGKGQQ